MSKPRILTPEQVAQIGPCTAAESDLLATLDAAQGEVRAWRERANEADRELAAAVDEIRRLEHAAEVWQRRYQDLVMEPLPSALGGLYRRAVVQVARVIGGRKA